MGGVTEIEMNVLSYHFNHDPNEFTADPTREGRGLMYGLLATFVLWAVIGLAVAAIWLR